LIWFRRCDLDLPVRFDMDQIRTTRSVNRYWVVRNLAGGIM
jgi:hypothetical protein